MNQVSRPTSVPADRLPSEMIELASAISLLPAEHRTRLEPLYQRVVENTRRRCKILNLVQEALGQLRLDMKYLLFDLEATRRERNEYKRTLEGGSE